MNRRSFLARSCAGAAAALAVCRGLNAQRPPVALAELTISASTTGRLVPETYTGLSYELAQLTEPGFFSASNHDLVAYFRLLSHRGVLRLGGNTSEFCWFRADSAMQAPKLHLPPGNLDANWMPHRLFAIAPEAVDNLAGFLQASGWRVIYGINFGNSTPERAAVEAAYAFEKLGKYLEFFQIGNEPDFYRDANNGSRPPGWDFSDYAAEWIGFANAISAKVPGARFGGPDVGASSDWITRFAQEVAPKLGNRLVALTGHYYAEGPPNDPGVTIKRLLRGDARIPAQMKQIEIATKAHGLTYRMTEGNSCYRGGKPGMSDALAAALWAGDYMLLLASLGCAGVNLHGGASRFLSAGLGDHTPGLEAATRPQAMRSGFYTPVATELGAPIRAMPVYYGMLLANQFAGATLVDSVLKSSTNATAYAAQTERGYRVAIFNKEENIGLTLLLRAPQPIKSSKVWRLQAPSLDSTSGVTLAGALIGPGANWTPKAVETIALNHGVVKLPIPAASAVLIFVE